MVRILGVGLTNNELVLVGFIITLWLASLGAVWKVATILSTVSSEMQDMRKETRANSEAIIKLNDTVDRVSKSVKSS